MSFTLVRHQGGDADGREWEIPDDWIRYSLCRSAYVRVTRTRAVHLPDPSSPRTDHPSVPSP